MTDPAESHAVSQRLDLFVAQSPSTALFLFWVFVGGGIGGLAGSIMGAASTKWLIVALSALLLLSGGVWAIALYGALARARRRRRRQEPDR